MLNRIIAALAAFALGAATPAFASENLDAIVKAGWTRAVAEAGKRA